MFGLGGGAFLSCLRFGDTPVVILALILTGEDGRSGDAGLARAGLDLPVAVVAMTRALVGLEARIVAVVSAAMGRATFGELSLTGEVERSSAGCFIAVDTGRTGDAGLSGRGVA